MDLPAEVVIAVLGLLAAPVLATVTWHLTRKKQTAETHSHIAQGANFAVDAMLKVLEQLRKEVAELTTEAELLRVENGRLHSEVSLLRDVVQKLGGQHDQGRAGDTT